MKTYEIITEWADFDAGIDTALLNKGYKKLGKGNDQHAWLDKDGTVLKIFGTNMGSSLQKQRRGKIELTPEQKMFKTFVDFCNANADNKFLPKFYGWEKFQFDGYLYLQIRQERLSPAGKLGFDVSTVGEVINVYGDDKKQIIEHCEDFWPNLVKACGSEQEVWKLVDTIIAVHSLGQKNRFRWDLHDENVMMRGKTPIIADPWIG